MTGSVLWTVAIAASASLATASVTTPVPAEPRVEHPGGHASKKNEGPGLPLSPVLGTLADTHTPDRVPLDDASPDAARFDRMLADRTTGAEAHLDPRLL